MCCATRSTSLPAAISVSAAAAFSPVFRFGGFVFFLVLVALCSSREGTREAVGVVGRVHYVSGDGGGGWGGREDGYGLRYCARADFYLTPTMAGLGRSPAGGVWLQSL